MRGTDRKKWRGSFACTFIAGIGLAMSGQVKGQYLTIYGGPTYDSSTGNGYKLNIFAVNPPVPETYTPGDGIGVGEMNAFYISGVAKGTRAVLWNALGAAGEMQNLGISSTGASSGTVHAINSSGFSVGTSSKYDAGSNSLGTRAVRWDSNGAVTELGNLGTDNSGSASLFAISIDNAGTMVGVADKFVGGVFEGRRAVRWDSAGNITELGNIGLDLTGFTHCEAIAINESGTIVGDGAFMGSQSTFGNRAIRWDASGTTATELGNLGTTSGSFTQNQALAINESGTAIGFAEKYTSGNDKGMRAVRWDASATAATELDNLGTDVNGVSASQAYAINDAGTIVGYADEYVGGINKGERAVRWEGSGTTATELGILGTDASGNTRSFAYGLNSAGLIVGSSQAYDNGNNLLGWHAVMWGADNAAIDLNTLIDPASGWVLTQADSISDDMWVSGIGSFDPDGPGPLPAYNRPFLIQVPEPTSTTLFAIGAVALLCRRRMNP